MEFLDLLLGCWRSHRGSQSPLMPEPATFVVLSTILGKGPHPLSCCHQSFQMEASCEFPLPLAAATSREIHHSSPALRFCLRMWGRNALLLVFKFYSPLPNCANPPWLEASFAWSPDNRKQQTNEKAKKHKNKKNLFFLFTSLSWLIWVMPFELRLWCLHG